MSSLPLGQTLENFDFAFQPAIERSRIDTLATCAWLRDAETVLLQGPPGVGKSHLCIALGVKALRAQDANLTQFRRMSSSGVRREIDCAEASRGPDATGVRN